MVTSKESKAREIIKKMIKEFSLVESPREMLEKASWYDLASSTHDLELTKRIMKEELNLL